MSDAPEEVLDGAAFAAPEEPHELTAAGSAEWADDEELAFGYEPEPPWLVPLYVLLVLAVGFVTYGARYWHQPHFAWDERYHVPAAYKYIDGHFFMEPHPPLGKQLIALGEWLLAPNPELSQKDREMLLGCERLVGEAPKDFNFTGVRLFPMLFAWLGCAVFFMVCLKLCDDPHLALMFSSLYVMDNALVMHFPKAMLDSFLCTFTLCALWWFAHCWRARFERVQAGEASRISPLAYAGLGALIGLATAVKVTGLALLLLGPALWLCECGGVFRRVDLMSWLLAVAKGALRAALMVTALAAVVLGSYLLHVVMLPHFSDFARDKYFWIPDDYVNATPELRAEVEELKALMTEGRSGDPASWPLQIKLHIEYVSRHNLRVPKVDYNSATEQGSFAVGWPIGHRAVCYHKVWWHDSDGNITHMAHCYLQGNPAVWLCALLGVLGCGALAIVRTLLRRQAAYETAEFRDRLQLAYVFAALWLGYMLAVMTIDRVMYLYHYFPPLLFGLLAFVALFSWRCADEADISWFPGWAYTLALGLVIAVLLCFLWFLPLTYALKMDKDSFERRNWFSHWRLRWDPPFTDEEAERQK